jgi:hypothetical protein
MFVKLWLVILLNDILPIYAYGVFFYLYLHTLTGNNVFIKKSFSSSFQILVSEAPCEVQMSLAGGDGDVLLIFFKNKTPPYLRLTGFAGTTPEGCSEGWMYLYGTMKTYSQWKNCSSPMISFHYIFLVKRRYKKKIIQRRYFHECRTLPSSSLYSSYNVVIFSKRLYRDHFMTNFAEILVHKRKIC